MAVDMQIVGETTAKLMDRFDAASEEEYPEGTKVIACAVIVCIERPGEKGDTYTNVFFDDGNEHYYRQLGLVHEALEVVTTGNSGEEEDDDH